MRTKLDPQLADAIADVKREGIPEWHAVSVDCSRRLEDEAFTDEDRTKIDLVRDLSIPGPGEDLPVRVYRPDVETPAPVLCYYHGGGWVVGTLDSIDEVCRMLAKRAGVIVVSVDYRLAPEHPFPSAVDDAYAALEWVAEHADAFGGDPDRLGVAGTSAGGNLAAVTALRSREFDGPELRHQLLLYPVTDHAFDTDSYEENSEGYLLSKDSMRWFWDQYLRSPVDGYNPFAAPLRADDLSELPPATVITCGYDPLRDEGVAYADRLVAAGVEVDHRNYPSMAHGFLSMTSAVDVADEAMDDVAASVRSRLE